MLPTQRRRGNHRNRGRHPTLLAVLALLIGGAVLAGCGSSSKAGYCNPVSKTENAIKSLPPVEDVKNTAQTTALKNSVEALSAVTLAQLPAQISAVSTAAKNLLSAVSSKCG